MHKTGQTWENVAAAKVGPLCESFEAGQGAVAGLSIPENLLVHLEVADTSDHAARGDAVALVEEKSTDDKWRQTEAEWGQALAEHTLVFLPLGSPPRYTGLSSFRDDPSPLGRTPSVTRNLSTRRWKELFSTLNSTCTQHKNNSNRRSYSIYSRLKRRQMV